MSFMELAKKRYSVRQYSDKPVEEQKLNEILNAGRIAPTGSNYQPQKVLVIQTKEGMQKLRNATKTFGATLALLVCCDTERVWVRPQNKKKIIDIDATIIADHMILRATELGLGSLWLAWFDPKTVINEFNVPDNLIPVIVLLFGYASGPAKSSERHVFERKPLSETVLYESF